MVIGCRFIMSLFYPTTGQRPVYFFSFFFFCLYFFGQSFMSHKGAFPLRKLPVYRFQVICNFFAGCIQVRSWWWRHIWVQVASNRKHVFDSVHQSLLNTSHKTQKTKHSVCLRGKSTLRLGAYFTCACAAPTSAQSFEWQISLSLEHVHIFLVRDPNVNIFISAFIFVNRLFVVLI